MDGLSVAELREEIKRFRKPKMGSKATLRKQLVALLDEHPAAAGAPVVMAGETGAGKEEAPVVELTPSAIVAAEFRSFVGAAGEHSFVPPGDASSNRKICMDRRTVGDATQWYLTLRPPTNGGSPAVVDEGMVQEDMVVFIAPCLDAKPDSGSSGGGPGLVYEYLSSCPGLDRGFLRVPVLEEADLSQYLAPSYPVWAEVRLQNGSTVELYATVGASHLGRTVPERQAISYRTTYRLLRGGRCIHEAPTRAMLVAYIRGQLKAPGGMPAACPPCCDKCGLALFGHDAGWSHYPPRREGSTRGEPLTVQTRCSCLLGWQQGTVWALDGGERLAPDVTAGFGHQQLIRAVAWAVPGGAYILHRPHYFLDGSEGDLYELFLHIPDPKLRPSPTRGSSPQAPAESVRNLLKPGRWYNQELDSLNAGMQLRPRGEQATWGEIEVCLRQLAREAVEPALGERLREVILAARQRCPAAYTADVTRSSQLRGSTAMAMLSQAHALHAGWLLSRVCAC